MNTVSISLKTVTFNGRKILEFYLMSVYIVLYVLTESVAQRFSVKKGFLKISQNSQENTCARVSFFNKVY